MCQEREPASAREEIFEQLQLITEISIWKQSKPRIMEIGSPKSRKCSVLHGGKAGKCYTRGIILFWENKSVGNVFQSFTFIILFVWSSRPKEAKMAWETKWQEIFSPLRNKFFKIQHSLCWKPVLRKFWFLFGGNNRIHWLNYMRVDIWTWRGVVSGFSSKFQMAQQMPALLSWITAKGKTSFLWIDSAWREGWQFLWPQWK